MLMCAVLEIWNWTMLFNKSGVSAANIQKWRENLMNLVGHRADPEESHYWYCHAGSLHLLWQQSRSEAQRIIGHPFAGAEKPSFTSIIVTHHLEREAKGRGIWKWNIVSCLYRRVRPKATGYFPGVCVSKNKKTKQDSRDSLVNSVIKLNQYLPWEYCNRRSMP